MKTKRFLGLFSVIISLSVLSSCSKDEYRKLNGMVWNTTFHITYDGERDLTDSVYAVLNQVSASLNVFDDSSLISKVNSADSIKVDNDFINVYNMSKQINRQSNGAFDPTLGPLIDAWGFGKGHTATVDTLRLDSLLNITGIGRTELRNGVLYKETPLIRFNFSAIAKGYGCDRIGEMLSANGAKSYLVEIGGEIRCAGKNAAGKNWKISIDKPILSDSVLHDSQCVIEVTDVGIATSGNYRNFHKSGASTYGHTISSTTGRPVQTDVLSATVVAKSCMEADGLATAMMAMGSKDGAALAEKMNVAVLLVLSDGSTWQNEAFTKLLSTE